MTPILLPEYLAVHKSYLAPLRSMIEAGRPKDEQETPEKAASLALFRNERDEDRPYELVKTVAVIPLRGYLFKRGWWWGTSFDAFADLIRVAIDDFAVDTILIDCETPGGSVYGCADCSDVLFRASKRKRVILCVNDLCASAGLWVGSAATEIVMTQSAEIGSIGVYTMRVDYTEALKKDGVRVDVIRAGKEKAWGSPYLPMSDEELKSTQAEVDRIYETFISCVARNRAVDATLVREQWADARMFTGAEAVEIGLADRVASFDQVLAELVGRPVVTGDNTNGPTSHTDHYATTTNQRRPVGVIRRRR